MYNVSDAYKTAIKKSVHQSRITGTVADIPFTNSNILKGSMSITNQCCGDTDVQIGQVYVGELDITLINLKVERYSLKDKIIKPIFGLKLADSTYEDVPLGEFIIDDVKYTAAGIVIKSYDNMSKLDKSIDLDTTSGTPFEFLTMICDKCDVVLGMTQAEVEALPNGTTTLGLYSNNDVETWRDFLAWLAQSVACFATMDRAGQLLLKQYNQTLVDTIDDTHRLKGSSFADYVTRYTGLSIVNIGDQTTTYYSVEVDDALVMNLGSNPLLQYGLDITKKAQREAILTAIQQINYVPFSVSMVGDPAYDLGDILKFSNGIADSTKLYCLTKFSWNYHTTCEMSGAGSDPKLAKAQSKTDKNLSGLLAQTDTNQIIFYLFQNASKVDIGDAASKDIADIRFTSTKNTQVEFNAEILLTSTGKETTTTVTNADNTTTTTTVKSKTVCKVTYYINDEEIVDYYPVETWDDGQHILNLYYALNNVEENKVYKWTVVLTITDGAITIPKSYARATIKGQGLAAELPWDGNLEVYESISGIPLGGLSIASFNVVANAALDTPSGATVSEVLGLIPLGGLTVGSFTDSVTTVKPIIVQNTIDTNDTVTCDTNYVVTQTQFKLRTSYSYESTVQTIDSGLMVAVSVDTTQYTVSAIEVSNG